MRFPLLAALLFATAVSYSKEPSESDYDPAHESSCPKTKFDAEPLVLGGADEDCVRALELGFKCCNKPVEEGCDYWELDAQKHIVLPSETKPGIAGNAAKTAKTAILNTNYHFAAAAVCSAARFKAERKCGTGPESKAPPELVKLQSQIDCYMSGTETLSGKAGEALGLYASTQAADAPRLAFNCGRYEIAGMMSKQCLIVDASQTSYDPNAPGSEAEISTGMTDRCTMFADDKGNKYSAAHCYEDGISGQMIAADGSVQPYSASGASGPEFNENAMNAGATYEDSTVYQDPNGPKGKPFYTMSRTPNPNLKSGCVIENEVFSCADDGSKFMNGIDVEIAALPGNSYPRGPAAMDSGTVALTKGVGYMDTRHRTMVINGQAYNGTSGAAAYIPAGTNVGGVILTKPLLIGPVSNIDPGQTPTDTLITVPIMGEDYIPDMTVQSVSDETLLRAAAVFGGGT